MFEVSLGSGVGRLALWVTGFGLAGAAPAFGADFTSRTSVSYTIVGETTVNTVAKFYGGTKTVASDNPYAQPATLADSIGGSQGGGDVAASMFANTTLFGGAGVMRARYDGSTSVTRVAGAQAVDARFRSGSVKVAWDDAYLVTGNPLDPRPGRPLVIYAYLNVSGSLTTGAVIPELYNNPDNRTLVSAAMRLTGRDALGQNVLGATPNLDGAFASEYRSTDPTVGVNTRPGPSVILLTMNAIEGVVNEMHFEMELTGVSTSFSNGFLPDEAWTTSGSFNADYGHTILWGGIGSIKDANSGATLSGWSIRSASGIDLADPVTVPEPVGVGVLALGYVVLSARARR